MSLFGGSKSKTEVQNEQNHIAETDLSDNAAIVNTNGSGNTVTLTDSGAVESAFKFAQDISETTGNTVKESIAAVTESARSETENIFINLQQFALYGGLIAGFVLSVRAIFKRR
jgi:single-stranded DNA-specific DHH superfamily exonuclease